MELVQDRAQWLAVMIVMLILKKFYISQSIS
jgi:hypothetical protein